MIGVISHQSREIEGYGEPAAAVLEQIFVALVGFLGRRKTREHAHGPEFAAIPGGVNAARVGRFPGIAEILFSVPIFGKVGCRIEAANRNIADGAEARVPVLVEIGAGCSADGPFGRLLNGGSESVFCPLFFAVGRMASFKNVGQRALGDLRLGMPFLLIGHASSTSSASMIEDGCRANKVRMCVPTGWLVG